VFAFKKVIISKAIISIVVETHPYMQ